MSYFELFDYKLISLLLSNLPGYETYLKILPYDLRCLLLHYFPEEDLYHFNEEQDFSLHYVPEFGAVNNERFWHSIWRTFFSKVEISDIYPNGCTTWKNTLRQVYKSIFNCISCRDGSCNKYYHLYEYGCELKLLPDLLERSKLIDNFKNRSLLRVLFNMNNVLVEFVINQIVGNDISGDLTRTMRLNLILEKILVYCHNNNPHKVERIRLLKSFISRYGDSIIAIKENFGAEERNSRDITIKHTINIVAKFGTVNDIFYIKKELLSKLGLNDLTKYDDKIFWSAVQANNTPIIYYYLPLNLKVEWMDCMLIAIQNNNLQLVKICCDNGADARKGRHIPLRLALENNNITIAKYLLEKFPL